MSGIRVRVGQPDLHVNVGQQDAIKVLASNTAVTSGIATLALVAEFANTSNSVIGGIASVTQLSVSGISSLTQLYVSNVSTFVGMTTFAGDVYFSGNIVGNLTTIDGGSF
jgi:hypothetical protein